ncbi:MAG: hypothetical protein ACJA1X_000454 [Bermanella sp.]|jgi:hypothetical protein
MDLSQYLSELDGQYRLYDVGRRIRKLDKTQFQQFENSEIAYPFPYLQHAWLALYISQKNEVGNETLWFLKWPLDEQGKLIQYVRDDLVMRLVRLSEQPLNVQADTEIEDPLKDNSFSFNPDDIRRANLSAMINHSQHRKPSSYYDTVVRYLQAGTLNSNELTHWQNLGMQGIADVAAKCNEHEASLKACLTTMPSEVYLAFGQCLEHSNVSYAIASAVLNRLKADLQKTHNASAVEASLRIIGPCFSDQLRIEAWQLWMNSDYKNNVACVLAFATRNFDDLGFMPETITPFLITLAEFNQQGSETFSVFSKIVGDLLFLPGIRNLLLNALRDPQRPAILGHAMQALLDSKKQ